ncbi:MAG TPA: hypothetical protein VFT65_09555 [Candidatus Angelobacter sp.]|nr:hypothetical protein [Candidatus Angelobacter sp.]
MNWSSWLLWGFAATVVLTTISSAAQGLGLTRMNLPYMLGTIFTPDREKAKLYGFGVHMFAGWIFSLIYVLLFQVLGAAGWWRGAMIGLIHAIFVLVVLMRLLPGLHSRMAGEHHGPAAHNMLEPPGFLALNYGFQTPLAILLSHIVFGIILGVFYRLN